MILCVDEDMNSALAQKFPNAEAFVFNSNTNSPLRELLFETYGDIYFLIVAPSILRSESFLFFKGSFYFQWIVFHSAIFCESYGFYANQIVAYGSVDCLLASKEIYHSAWKEMVGRFFIDDNPYKKKEVLYEAMLKNHETYKMGAGFWMVNAVNSNGFLVENTNAWYKL